MNLELCGLFPKQLKEVFKVLKPTVDIGIPALNEEENIRQLLESLLSQSEKGFSLRKIFVCSDGSTDKTVTEVKKIKDQRIKLIIGKQRKGNGVRQNEILSLAQADSLVILNADILIKDKEFVARLVKPVLEGKADLVSPALCELPPRNFLEKVLALSLLVKKEAFENYNGGVNLLNCHGAARAFSQKLYRKLRFPQTVGEDAFGFLFCLYHGFTYLYLPEAVCYFRLPGNFTDHQRQSLRYFATQKIMTSFFPKSFVQNAYHFPKKLLLQSFSYYVFKKPIHCLVYIIWLFTLRVKALFSQSTSYTWEIAKSSKAVYD
jgi:glycosyltransferase involved in cell wall biosynthesis